MAEHDIVSIGMCSKIVLLRIFHDHTIYEYTLYRYPGPSSSSPVIEGEEELGSEELDTLLHRP